MPSSGIIRSVWIILILMLTFGCAAPQVNVRVNGVGLPQQAQVGKMRVGSNEVTVYWFYARHHDRTLESKTGLVEVVPDRQPLEISEKPQRLSADTKDVGIVISIDNPNLQRYRVIKIATDDSTQRQGTVYEGIRDYQELYVAGLPPTNSSSKIGVKVELIGTDNASVVDSLYLGDLKYSVASNDMRFKETGK